jgi:hypothetical protein
MWLGIASVLSCVGIALLIMLASIAAGRVKRSRNRARLDEVFDGRERLAIEEFHSRYVEPKGVPFIVSAGVIKVLERELQVDLSRATAADDFSGNLSFLRDSLEDPNTLLSLEDVFEVTFSESDVHDMGTTVGDIIDLVWKTLRKNGSLVEEGLKDQ